MSKCEGVEIPIWMRKLPVDKRGYPVPVTVQRDSNGRPHFTITDSGMRQRTISRGLCHICGRQLMRRRALVGGAIATFHPHGAFMDGPMHRECATFALKVCPYLAAPNYSKRIDERTWTDKNSNVKITNVGEDSDTDKRPELFCLVIYDKENEDYIYDPIDPKFIQYVKPRQPYYHVEYWRHGEPMPFQEAMPYVDEALQPALQKSLADGTIDVRVQDVANDT